MFSEPHGCEIRDIRTRNLPHALSDYTISQASAEISPMLIPLICVDITVGKFCSSGSFFVFYFPFSVLLFFLYRALAVGKFSSCLSSFPVYMASLFPHQRLIWFQVLIPHLIFCSFWPSWAYPQFLYYRRVYPKVSGLSRNEVYGHLWYCSSRVMTAKLTRLTHKIAIQVHLVAESCTICSSRSRRPVRKRLDTPSYVFFLICHR
jgi:hypothetical protein